MPGEGNLAPPPGPTGADAGDDPGLRAQLWGQAATGRAPAFRDSVPGPQAATSDETSRRMGVTSRRKRHPRAVTVNVSCPGLTVPSAATLMYSKASFRPSEVTERNPQRLSSAA